MITNEEKALLLERIKLGDRHAEQQFCESYYASTLGLARKLVRERSLADDLTQDALLTVILKMREGKVEQAFLLDRYVNQTTRFTVISWYRRKANQDHHSIDDHPVLDARIRAEDELFEKERREIVAALIDSLSVARDREVLTRHYLQDEDKSAICSQQDLTSQHFDRVISRARNRCKALVAKQSVAQFSNLIGSY